jgi:membrane protease YdiL (CAAX protease family)
MRLAMRVIVAFVLLWIVLDRTAVALGSTRGEAGLAIAALLTALALIVEWRLAGSRLRHSLRSLGFGTPARRALLAAFALSAVLLAFFPVLAAATNQPIAWRAGAAWLALGMFAQGGIAEELLFRGFLYRHFRVGRTFWRAATLAAIPFVAVHVTLFLTLEFAVALAAVFVSVSLSFPLAWLFDRARGSFWPGAIVHAVVQAPIKLVIVDEGSFLTVAVAWMALGALAPWALFLLRPEQGAPPKT